MVKPKLSNWQRNYVVDSLFSKKNPTITSEPSKKSLKFKIGDIEYNPTMIGNMSKDVIKKIFNIDIPSTKPNNIPNSKITDFSVVIKQKYRTDSAIVIKDENMTDSGIVIKEENITESIIKDYMGEPSSPFPSNSSKPVNDIDNINADNTAVSNVSSGNQDDDPKTGSNVKIVKVSVNQNDRVRQDGIDPVIEDNITPASKLPDSNPEPDYINIKSQQESKVDSNLNHDISRKVKLQDLETIPQKDLPQNVNTDNQTNIYNNISLLETPVSKSINSDPINDQYVDILNKEATLVDAEVKNAVVASEEDIDTKLREFLTTYNPETIDYTSPDAMKQYALLTTHLLKQLNDKVEFIPEIDKGVKKVEKIQAQINQSSNIIKEPKVEIPQDQNNLSLDGIYDKYITEGDMKYLPEDLYHPALTIGGLRN